MMLVKEWWKSPLKLRGLSHQRVYREGDDGGDGGDAGDDGEGDGGSGGGGGSGDPPKSFTQQQVDDIVKARLRKERTEKEKLIKDLTTLKESKNLTDEERQSLSSRVEELETSLLDKDQQAARERTKIEKDYQNKLKQASDESETWRNRYTNSQLDRALTDAAVASKAESPEQIRMMFKASTYLAEDKDPDTGKPLGTFTPRMKFQGKEDDSDNFVAMDLPVADAMKKIREDGSHKNLFKHEAVGGTGQLPSGGQGKGVGTRPDPSNYSDPLEFQKDFRQWKADGGKLGDIK